ncbi:MarR family transcriptional regulator [Fluviicola sp.]|jgi:DNA-binding MarR family transcriptional regulator|uniref:MarR family winged helix-turn-helix transcriptional regulator n=1 Tax=Fluviicola sp. TaxID=1917219 RepID=UPI00262A4743|nr:MarR family transcriptional regulator [Fluviicola sp.]
MQNKPQYLIDLDVRLTWHKMSRMYNQRANSYGISMSVGFILLHIDREGTPSTQLGPRMGMEPTSLSRTLKTMEEKGFIRREEDKLDKRIVRIFLTEEGLKARYIARDVVFEFNNKVIERIPKEHIDIFESVVNQIQEILDEENSGPSE